VAVSIFASMLVTPPLESLLHSATGIWWRQGRIAPQRVRCRDVGPVRLGSIRWEKANGYVVRATQAFNRARLRRRRLCAERRSRIAARTHALGGRNSTVRPRAPVHRQSAV